MEETKLSWVYEVEDFKKSDDGLFVYTPIYFSTYVLPYFRRSGTGVEGGIRSPTGRPFSFVTRRPIVEVTIRRVRSP